MRPTALFILCSVLLPCLVAGGCDQEVDCLAACAPEEVRLIFQPPLRAPSYEISFGPEGKAKRTVSCKALSTEDACSDGNGLRPELDEQGRLVAVTVQGATVGRNDLSVASGADQLLKGEIVYEKAGQYRLCGAECFRGETIVVEP